MNSLPVALLRRMIVAGCVWMLLFSAGMLVDSRRFRDSLIYSDDFLANLIFLPLAIFTFTPCNVAILSVVSGYLGGLLGNVRAPGVEKDLGALQTALDAVRRELHEKRDHFLKTPGKDLQTTIDALTEKERLESAELAKLERHLRFLQDHAVVSAVRGLVVYLVYLVTVLLTTNQDFNAGSLGMTMTDPETVVTQMVVYIRFAGLVSILAFAFGYDPSSFEALLGRATRFMDHGKSA